MSCDLSRKIAGKPIDLALCLSKPMSKNDYSKTMARQFIKQNADI